MLLNPKFQPIFPIQTHVATSHGILEIVTCAHIVCDVATWHLGWNLGGIALLFYFSHDFSNSTLFSVGRSLGCPSSVLISVEGRPTIDMDRVDVEVGPKQLG